MGLLAPALLLTAGCAAPPAVPRGSVPAAAPLATLARQVTIEGPHGRLGPAEREALLRRIGQQGSAGWVQRHLAAMTAFGEVDLTVGNDARLLLDGPATFAAMFEAIERARDSVLLESYIIEDAAIAERLAALLRRKAAQGLQVAVMYDAIGSLGTDARFFEALRAGGVAVCAFNPLNPLGRRGYWNIAHRDHRKILAVDREIAFTGGINISEVYSSGSSGAFGRGRPDPDSGWRDTQIALRGPAALALDGLVRASWARQSCPDALPEPPPRPRPAALAAGGQAVRIVPATPTDAANRIYALLLHAIDAAGRSVHLTMAYFAPGDDMIDALCDAAQRGVDVQLILPSMSDFSPVLHAGRRHYQRLLEAGVKIHELQDAVLHAKTAVVDGVVSTVGSSNMDWRSWVANDEVNAVVIGEDFGDAMERMFARDRTASQPITPEAWRSRPPWQRLKETLAGWLERWW